MTIGNYRVIPQFAMVDAMVDEMGEGGPRQVSTSLAKTCKAQLSYHASYPLLHSATRIVLSHFSPIKQKLTGATTVASFFREPDRQKTNLNDSRFFRLVGFFFR